MKINILKKSAILAVCLGVSFNLIIGIDFTPKPAYADVNSKIYLDFDKSMKASIESLGITTDQPTRTDINGDILNKGDTNPFGVAQITINKVQQLAIAGKGDDNSELYDVYKNPLKVLDNNSKATSANYVDYSSSMIGQDYLKGVGTDASADWRKAYKATVSGDINGNGKEVTITAAIPAIDSSDVSLELELTDYDDGKKIEKDFTAVESIPKPIENGIVNYPIHAVMGDFNHDAKDEIAVVVSRTLYIFSVTDTSCTLLSSEVFDESSELAIVPNIDGDRPEIDIEAGDSDGDGYKELLVTTGSSEGGHTYTPRLLIYNGVDLSKPVTNIEMKLNDSNNDIFKSPSVDVGNIVGDSNKEIIIGGLTTLGNTSIAYISYNQKTKSYDKALGKHYNLVVQGVKSPLMGLKCVYLDGYNPSNYQTLVFGDMIFGYNKITDGFDQIKVTNIFDSDHKSTNNTGRLADLSNKSIDKDKGDKTYIINTIVGNFDGNSSGKQQIILLHYNIFHGNYYIYVTSCSKSNNGTINASMLKVWSSKKSSDKAYFPSVAGVDVYGNGVRFEYTGGEFTYSDPKVMAVFGAAPYYNEIKDSNYTANVLKTSTSSSKGFEVNTDMSIGYNSTSPLYGYKIAEVGIESIIRQNMLQAFKSMSLDYLYSVEVKNSKDMVMLITIPYDVYHYNVYINGQKSQINLNLPYKPVTTLVSLAEYNNFVSSNSKIKLSTIGNNLLNHTLGDPRTYPNDIASVRVPSTVNQDGTKTKTAQYDKQAVNSMDIPYILDFKGSSATINVGMPGKGNAANVSTKFINLSSYTANVAEVTSSYKDYGLSWDLEASNYVSTKPSNSMNFMEFYFMVLKGEIPPPVPQNLRAVDISSGAATIQWDKVDGASYKLTRYTGKEGMEEKVTNISDSKTTIFKDSDLKDSTTYYYKVAAANIVNGESIYSMNTEGISISTLIVKEIKIKSQPTLSYISNDALDLSGLVVTLVKSDNTSQDVKYQDFGINSLKADFDSGIVLSENNNNKKITITHIPSKVSITTEPLSVFKDKTGSFTLSVDFKGGQSNQVSKLIGGQLLTAETTVTNNLSSLRKALLIIALYDENGNQVSILCEPIDIDSKASVATTGAIKLPSKIDNYKLNVFIWDGDDISTSTQTILSNTISLLN